MTRCSSPTDGGHFVSKVTLDGKVLLELGVPGKPSPYMSGEPFHRCDGTAHSVGAGRLVVIMISNTVHEPEADPAILMAADFVIKLGPFYPGFARRLRSGQHAPASS